MSTPPVSPVVRSRAVGLYVHVPFCKTKCPYCDFNTYQGIENQMGSYRRAVTTELEMWGAALGPMSVSSLFFGGGTPSYLPEGDIEAIIERAASGFRLDDGAEITLEANPGDLDDQACRGLLASGVNRLSIGVQSLDDKLLALIGRRHNAEHAIAAFQTSRAAGFDNVNLDLMYGLPGQTMAQWRDSIERLVALSPEHVSLYALTLEEGTPLRTWADQGKIAEPDPDLAADMYDCAVDLLGAAGYHHYEISNWALPGRESQHNLTYWRNEAYLGVGPGAHSRLGEYRFWTVLSPRDYALRSAEWSRRSRQPWPNLDEAALKGAPTVSGWEHIDQDTRCAETMFLGLRLLDGLQLSVASSHVAEDLSARYEAEIRESVELGLLLMEGDTLRLHPSAYLIANQVFTRFL